MLKVENITKRLPDGKILLDGISFEVEHGEFVGILGPSGAGKSLTMRCVLGLTSPDSGSVKLSGVGMPAVEVTCCTGRELRDTRKRMGVVFQGFNLVRRLSVLDNVMMGKLGSIHPLRSWLYGFTDEEAALAMATLERVGMASFADRIVGSLSGGEMQRIAVARAIYQDPVVMLADEPIASLDPKNAHEIMKLLKPISEEIPICGVFHQPEITAEYCTRVIGIKDGCVVYDGKPDLTQDELKWLYGDELEELDQEAHLAPTLEERETGGQLLQG